VVVLDNLWAHKGDRARELVEEKGARRLLFLPSYSPDFSPIEEALGKLKALLRREKARTKETLLQAIGRALNAKTRPRMPRAGSATAATPSLSRCEKRCRRPGFT
jgi:transposase